MKQYWIRFDIIQYKLKMMQCKWNKSNTIPIKVIYIKKNQTNNKKTHTNKWNLNNKTGEDRLLQSLACHTMNIQFNLIIFKK